jgi:uncharacterized protein (TIGR01777 family)
VARAWERAVQGADTRRLVVLRTALVLDEGTPALERLCGLVRVGLGGRMGPGDQWVSWIHVDDFVRAVRFVRDQPALGGVVHLTAPEPVRNRDMMATLRAALGRPWSPPIPRPVVELGARVLRTDPALALTGRRCVPRRLLGAGFAFEHPTFDDAVADLLGA